MADLYQNREISTLAFNERVLQEAEDSNNPLLERLKFLGIFSSNMDEFYKVRVANIRRQIEMGKSNVEEVALFLEEKSLELDHRFQGVYKEITKSLRQNNLKILYEHELRRLGQKNQEWLHTYFKNFVLQDLAPIMVHTKDNLPTLTDGDLYFAIELDCDPCIYSVMKIPDHISRFITLPSGQIIYVDDLIRLFMNDIFYMYRPKSLRAFGFKVLRDAELDIDNDFSADYIRQMKKVLEKRKGGRPSRLVYDRRMPDELLSILKTKLEIGKYDPVIGGGRYHNMKDLIGFPVKRADLCFPPFEPAPHPSFDKQNVPILDIIEKQDELLTYPYQSFTHLVRLLREASIDPQVDQIKMTLYRVATRSQVVNALVNAARNGKKVFVSIELQARFDEKNNINIAEKLTKVGATVVFGVPPMKVHCKLLLIKRSGKYIAGLSTGNFHEKTGRLYVDSLLLTSHQEIAREANSVFKYLKSASKIRVLKVPRFKHLFVSPFNSRRLLTQLIKREKNKGKKGYICFKTNHVTDEKLQRALLSAADAGVKIDMIVRTTYTVKPHKNIDAISILDRFLEHQRIYIFGKGKDRKIYMASADAMERNLDHRIEVGFPIYDKRILEQVEKMLSLQLQADTKARIHDALQSNAYVGDRNGLHHAQMDSAAYFRSISTQKK